MILVTANLILSARVEIFVITYFIESTFENRNFKKRGQTYKSISYLKELVLFLSNYWLRVFKMEEIKRVG